MGKFHISLHLEVEADNIFIAQRKGENIANNISEEYNPFVEGIIEEKEKICGNCKCYDALQFHSEMGRCCRYNVIVQLRTHCLEKKHYVCKCSKTQEYCKERRE